MRDKISFEKKAKIIELALYNKNKLEGLTPVKISNIVGVKAKTVSAILQSYKRGELNFYMQRDREDPENKKINNSMLSLIY